MPVVQFLFEDQGEETAEEITSDGLIPVVVCCRSVLTGLLLSSLF
jgi:hypothetical protein